MADPEFPFDEALPEFSHDPNLAEKWRTLVACEPGWDETRRALEDNLIRQLKAGQLIASFRAGSAPGTIERADIQPIWWRTADYEIDDFGGLVETGGRKYEDISIRRATVPVQSAHPANAASQVSGASSPSIPAPTPSLALLPVLQAAGDLAAPTKPKIVDEIGDDRLRWSRKFRLLTLDEQKMDFTGDVHVQIIDGLMRGYISREVLSMNDILKAAKSGVTTLEKAFRGSPNWLTLATILRVEKDRCWFELPPEG